MRTKVNKVLQYNKLCRVIFFINTNIIFNSTN